jgi:recombination protein RecT
MSTSKITTDKRKANVTLFKNQLYAYKDRITDLLTTNPNINVERFLAMAYNAVKRDKKLLAVVEKNPASLFASLLLCAEYGLSPSPEVGECWLIPYGDVCQFQLGYQGLVKLAYRNPAIKSISAELVYETDDFEYGLGLDPFLNHKPSSGERGQLTHVYSVVKFREGEPMFKVMSRSELQEIQSISKAGNKGIWFNRDKDPQGWMLKKTCLKQLLKLVPKEFQLGSSLHYDNVVEGGGFLTLDGDEIIEVNKRSARNFGKSNVFAQALSDGNNEEEVIEAEEVEEPKGLFD